MSTYFISRHPSTIEWAQSHDLKVDHWISHLENIEQLCAGDTVIGTLPVNIIAMLCERKIRYIHFSLQIPEALRGVELDTEQLASCNPELVRYQVMRLPTS